ncbi:MAG: ABC transporter ATP-binding protein [Kiritimatiellia bacterium]
MAGIRLQDVGKEFGAHRALCDVSFSIANREFFVVVGPSGCGKSTLLRLLAGLEQVSRGRIFIGERLVNDIPPGRRNVAMVFQNYALFPHLTVFENMAFGLRIRRLPRREADEMVLRTARVLELDPLLQKRPAQLSGGQRQRVALGRAMVRQPEVFLYDEPLSNLDARLRSDMRSELLRLHKRARTTAVYVTHDQVEAMTLGDRICVIRDGVVQQVASAMDVYHRPVNLFVATFLGAPPMNVLPGRLESAGEHCRLLLDGGRILPLTLAGAAQAWRHCLNRPVSLGVRPEVMQPASAENAPLLQGAVEVAEVTGGECYVHFREGDARLVARMSVAHKPELGEGVSFSFPASGAHLFDEHGRRVEAQLAFVK